MRSKKELQVVPSSVGDETMMREWDESPMWMLVSRLMVTGRASE